MAVESNIEGVFAYGAENVHQIMVIDPELINESSSDDLIKLLYNEGYNTTQLQQITRDNSACSNYFTVVTTSNTLKIHLYWAGKGTTEIPVSGSYGPLISARSVVPNFTPPSVHGEMVGTIATLLTVDAVNNKLQYIDSTSNPTAMIKKSLVANFSSRGPSLNDLFILKPDVAAQGLNNLAAYSPAEPLTPDKEDGRRVRYNMQSSTSMAYPHVSATATYVKSFHPT